jgi:dihydroorotase (homodimeric type)
MDEKSALHALFGAMQSAKNLHLCIHCETTDASVDIFDREAAFVPVLDSLLRRFPALAITVEHISTRAMLGFVATARKAGARIAATVTPHHLLWNRNDLLKDTGGLAAHRFCHPILKTRADQLALQDAVTSAAQEGYLFLGSDSAPHPVHRKESRRSPAGVFASPTALAAYADVFERKQSLHKLQAFASTNAKAWYQLDKRCRHSKTKADETKQARQRRIVMRADHHNRVPEHLPPCTIHATLLAHADEHLPLPQRCSNNEEEDVTLHVTIAAGAAGSGKLLQLGCSASAQIKFRPFLASTTLRWRSI